ncbi:uncharacterized protein LOC122650799 [Telopea speciosissima]|uniref:uncharacterized protein LOC122650799 n=1 Tax=Telopea speciosissima TaxID=54955 RepID=UPI001CC49B2B|nr:uncharacterized protein LOC122650799 [Telopea speciosissima]
MEPAIASNVMYHSTAKGVWTDLRETYSQAKNVSRIYEIYEKLFTHKQGDRSLSEFFGSFKGLIEELQVYQPFATDAEVLSLNETFGRLQRLSSAPKNDSSSEKDSSTFVASRGRGSFSSGKGGSQGRGRGRGNGGRGSVGQFVDKAARHFSPTPNITLSSVLHVPQLPLSLLSDLQTGSTIGGGLEQAGLYYLDGTGPSSAATASTHPTSHQWHVYKRRKATVPSATVPAPALPSTDVAPAEILAEVPSPDLPIAKRKGTRSCTTRPVYPIEDCWNFSSSLPFRNVAFSLSSSFVPKTHKEALSHLGWKGAMDVEMDALLSCQTWTLVDLPPGKDLMDIKNALLYVFIRRQGSKLVVLVVYVDDIIISGNDESGIADVKSYLHKQFQMKDLGHLSYFLGIEVLRSKKGISLSQRKYVLDLLSDTGMLASKPADTPMDPHQKFGKDDGDNFDDEAACRILRYLKGAPGKGLIYQPRNSVDLVGFSDADWAGFDSDRRSTTGYCTFVGGNLVTWRSKKQATVSKSSA